MTDWALDQRVDPEDLRSEYEAQLADEHAAALRASELAALKVLSSLALEDSCTRLKGKTPDALRDALDDARYDIAQGEGWDGALAGLAETIHYAAWDVWALTEWVTALHAAAAKDYDRCDELIQRIERVMDTEPEFGLHAPWRDRNEPIGG